MNCVNFTRRIFTLVVLLASIVTGRLQMIHADEVPSKLTVYATERGQLATLMTDYRGEYAYGGPDHLDLKQAYPVGSLSVEGQEKRNPSVFCGVSWVVTNHDHGGISSEQESVSQTIGEPQAATGAATRQVQLSG